MYQLELLTGSHPLIHGQSATYIGVSVSPRQFLLYFRYQLSSHGWRKQRKSQKSPTNLMDEIQHIGAS